MVVNLSANLGAAFGAWCGGRLFDVSESYALTFATAIASGLLAISCMWIGRHEATHNTASVRSASMAGALAGTTVLELTRVSPGSFCTMILADMGADVLKIETPPALSPGSGSGMSAGTERQAAFSYVNRNKRSLGLNLKAPEGHTHPAPTGGTEPTSWSKVFDQVSCSGSTPTMRL